MTNVIELAKQAGIPLNKYELIGCNRCQRDIDDELERFATLVRNAALEEAAQKCKSKRDTLKFHSHQAVAQECAEAIKSLKEPTP